MMIPREMPRIFVGKQDASIALGVSVSTLKKWRLGNENASPVLTEGVHWLRVGPRLVLYNVDLLQDFMHNRGNPSAHKRAIEAYLASLPSSKVSP